MRIVRVGACNREGCCCSLAGDGNPRLKGGGVCQFLVDTVEGRVCTIKLDELSGLSRWALRNRYGVETIKLYELCSLHDDNFPAPQDFGFNPETERRRHAEGLRAHLESVLRRFRRWKERTGCTFEFKIVEE